MLDDNIGYQGERCQEGFFPHPARKIVISAPKLPPDGDPVVQPQPSAYIRFDTGRRTISLRLRNGCANRGLSFRDVTNRLCNQHSTFIRRSQELAGCGTVQAAVLLSRHDTLASLS